MKKILLTLLSATSLMAADFTLKPQCTANGCGKIYFDCCNSCVLDKTNLMICGYNIPSAMEIMMRKSKILGQKIYLLVYTSQGEIIQTASPCFYEDKCFEYNRSLIMQNPKKYGCMFFNFLDRDKNCLGRGIFIAPNQNGACDPNNQLRTYAATDGSL